MGIESVSGTDVRLLLCRYSVENKLSRKLQLAVDAHKIIGKPRIDLSLRSLAFRQTNFRKLGAIL